MNSSNAKDVWKLSSDECYNIEKSKKIDPEIAERALNTLMALSSFHEINDSFPQNRNLQEINNFNEENAVKIVKKYEKEIVEIFSSILSSSKKHTNQVMKKLVA